MLEAITYCQKHNILSEFLEDNAKEVLNMLMTEFNLEDAKEVWLEEGKLKGLEEGEKRGKLKGLEEGEKNKQREVLRLIRSGASLRELEEMLEDEDKRS
jgi:predicted transposase YdaD